METYSSRDFADMGIISIFVQDNQSFSAQKGTLRGIHFQNAPMAQAKFVRVTRGAVKDIAVDLRKGSPTICNGWLWSSRRKTDACSLFPEASATALSL